MATGRISKINLSQTSTPESIAKIGSSIFKRVHVIKSAFDAEMKQSVPFRLPQFWRDSDTLILHASQDDSKTISVVRQLDQSLPSDVQVVVVQQASLLESQFGIVPDNYVWTVRFLSKSEPQVADDRNGQKEEKKPAYYKFDAEGQVWRKVQKCNLE